MLLSSENLCKICFEFACENNIYTECGCSACNDCQQSWIRSQLEDGRSIELRCPMSECKCIFSVHQVQILLSPENQELYQRAQSLIYFRESKDIRMCPIPKCEYAGFTVQGQYEFFCPNCSQCWEEKRNTFVNILNSLKTASEEVTSALWVGVFCKHCPGCQVNIEKESGCSHMKCWTCNYQFCWNCMDKWAEHDSNKCMNTTASSDITLGTFICMAFRVYYLSPEIYWFMNLMSYYIGFLVLGVIYAFIMFSMLRNIYLQLFKPFREYRKSLVGYIIITPSLLYWLNSSMTDYIYISICISIGDILLFTYLTFQASKTLITLLRR